METETVAAVAIGSLLVLAGCTTLGGPGSCDRASPQPIPDVRLINRLDDPQSLTVRISHTNGSAPVYENTATVPPNEELDWFDTVAEEDRYLIAASLPDSTSATREMELDPDDRYSIITVLVDEEGIAIERFGIHPGTTPTPCK